MQTLNSGSVDSVPGFRAVGVSCGIKSGGEPDLGVLLCEHPCNAAGIFTTNRVQAAPVRYCRQVLSKNAQNIRAIVVNAGNANACTGEQGFRDAAEVAGEAERLLGVERGAVLVMSTGVIGEPLPVDKLKAGLLEAQRMFSTGKTGGFTRAILTTDTREKSLAVEFELQGVPVTLGAAAKGAGMIHPNMATMLAFFTTDAALTPEAASAILHRAAERTFNMISVDGDRSPNDSVFLLASGTSGAPLIRDPESAGFEIFYTKFLEAATELARRIAADGEGATKLVEIRVRGADSFASASRVARAVANSPLVKTALYGADPNWGRILCAAGYSGVDVEPEKIDIFFNSLQAVKAGAPAGVPERELTAQLNNDEVILTLDLHQGDHECRFWTCDFSYNYVKINADYRT